MFLKISLLTNFPIFTGKYLCWSLFLLRLQTYGMQETPTKETPTQVFFFECCKIFKKSLFHRTHPVAAFVLSNIRAQPQFIFS